jgi:integrase
MLRRVATSLATQPRASDRTRQHSPDGAPDVSSDDAPRQDWPDGFLPTRNRKVVGSNPTSSSTNQQLTAHIAPHRPGTATAGDRYRPRPGLREREHPTDCLRGLPMSPSAVRDVHAVLAGAFKTGPGLGLDRPQPDDAGHPPSGPATRRPAAPGHPGRTAYRHRYGRGPGAGAVPGPGRRARRPPGRVCRLRWSHINLDRGEILVGGKITSLPGELRDEEWIKNRSKRRVAIGPAVWSYSVLAGWSRPNRRSPAESVSRLMPTCSATRPTVPARSGPTG